MNTSALAAPFTPSQSTTRRTAGARHTSLHTPHANRSPDYEGGPSDEQSSAATSPNTVASSLSTAGGGSRGSTRPSSFEVLRAGRGSLDAVAKRPLFKVRSADSRPDSSWQGAASTLDSKGKARAAWEVEGREAPSEHRRDGQRSSIGSIINGFAGGSSHDEHSHAGLGIGLTRSFKSGSITGLAERASDVGPVFTPLQPPRSSAGEPDHGYASRSVPTDSAKTLRKVASSNAALMGGPVVKREVTPSGGWHDGRDQGPEGDYEGGEDGGQPVRRQRWHSHPADEYAPPSPLVGAGDVAVRHTTHVTQRRDKFGRLLINNYMRGREIGRGVHGVVYIGKDTYCRVDRKSDTQSEGGEVEDGAAGEDGEGAKDEDFLTVAIKVVRRDPRTKSLRRSQQQRQRRQAEAEESLAEVPGEGRIQLLRDVDDKLKREIAIMKRLKHDNIVSLFEVIDDVKSKKVFMILEFMEGGQVAWQDPVTHAPLMTVEQARKTFRHVVLGLEYLHHQGIIHRDIKPANLLWTADREVVKISDFGVSHLSSALRRTSSKLSPINETRPPSTTASDDRALRKTEGSPAFMAPELCCPIEVTPRPTPSERDALDYFTQQSPTMREPLTLQEKPSPPLRGSRIISRPLPRNAYRRGERPPVGKGIDIWALGVTLYCLLFGKTPFDAPNEYELFNVIWNKPAVIPDFMGADRKPTFIGDDASHDGVHERDARHLTDLLGRLLEKDPRRRITLDQVKTHAWVLSSLERPKRWIDETKLAEGDTIVVTQDDVANFTQPLTTSPTLTKPLGSVKQSLRKAAIKLGLRAGDSSVPRVRTKSVSSTSASACTSPQDAQEVVIMESLSRNISRTNGHRYGRSGARSPSPSRSPAGKQSPDGSTRRAFSLRHGWHSARATPPQPATPVQTHSQRSTQIHLPSDDLRNFSGSSTASSGNASPTMTRSSSGQHLRTPFQDNRHLRSVPASPLPPPSAHGAGFQPRAVSPALSASENEGKHSLKERLSRVKQKLTGHARRGSGGAADSAHRRIESQDTRDMRSEAASQYGFGDVSTEGSELDLTPAIHRERELLIASRIPPPIARDVFYTTEEDELEDSLSEIDDDEDFGSDDSALENQQPFAVHDGTTLRFNPAALNVQADGSELPRPTIAARRLSPRPASGTDFEATPKATQPSFAPTTAPQSPTAPAEEPVRSSLEGLRSGRASSTTPSRRSRSLRGNRKPEEDWVSATGIGDGGQADDEDEAGGLDFEIKSRKRRGTTASHVDGPWD